MTRLRQIAGALLLAWIAFWFLAEVNALRRDTASPPNPGIVAHWGLSTPRAQGFGYWVAKMRPEIPAGAVVVLTSSTGNREQDFFLTLWAAYHLPRHRVIGTEHPEAWTRGEYLLAYDTKVETAPDGRRLSVVAEDHVGVLYRIDPMAPAKRETP